MVNSKLNLKSNVAIIIDQPSVEDEAKKQLMSDPIMQMVGQYLMKAGIFLGSVSIIPVVRERHPKIERLGGSELHCWKELLKRDLEKLHATGNLNLIITVGELALSATTGKKGHDKYRGSVIPCSLIDCKTLVLWNPAHASDPKTPWINVYKARPEWKPFTNWDCDKAKRHSKTKEYLRPPFEIEVCRDLALLEKEFLSEDYINDPNSKLGFDIEASYSEMTCIGFAKSENKAYVIPLVHMDGIELSNALKLIDKILSSPVKKAAQNGNFDITFLAYYYKIKVVNFYWDTMLCFHAMFPNLPKGLGILGSIFTEAPYWKDMAKGDEDKQWMLPHHKVDWPTFFQYNGEDAINLITIWNNQEDMIKERGTWDTFRREMALCYPLITIECFGTKINTERKEQIKQELEIEIAKWELFFHHLCMENSPNIQSPKQLKEFLYETMKLPRRVKKGKITADVDALTSLIKYNPYVIKPIMLLRDLKKQRSFTEVKLAEDGRVRTTFKPGGTQTGRLSSSGSLTGVGCVRGDVEVLTKNGWISFDKYTPQETLVWDIETKEYSWEVPKKVQFPYSGIMYKAENNKINASFTPEHRMPMYTHNNKHIDMREVTIADRAYMQTEFRSSSDYTCGTIDEPLIRLIAMCSADGSYENGHYRINVTKQRKIDRFISLCNDLDVDYVEHKTRPGYRRFCINTATSSAIYKYLGKNKTFGDWLLKFNLPTLKNFISEVAYWDSHIRGKSYIYFSAIKENALWVEIIAHLTGLSGAFYKRRNNRYKAAYGYKEGVEQYIYAVNVRPSSKITIRATQWSEEQYTGNVYCLTTTTGYFLARSNDKVFLSGNSNLQQQPKFAKKFYVPDNGKIIIQADYSKAESWIVAALAEDQKMLDALYSADFHSTNASNLLGRTVTKADYSDRQLGKKVSHGCCDGSTEVLTPSGWVRFDALQDGTKVAQWDTETKKVDFVVPSIVTRAPYKGDMIKLRGRSYDMLITPNHRMGFYTYNDKFRIEEAEEFIKRKSARIPLVGYYENATESRDKKDLSFIQLLVATQADGSINGSNIRFRLKKHRKIIRLISILNVIGLSYSVNTQSDGSTSIILHKQLSERVKEYLDKTKTFGDWLFKFDAESLDTFIKELPKWDGYYGNSGRTEYVTTNKENAEWVQTIAHLRGKQALLSAEKDRPEGRKDLYTVSFNNRKLARLENMYEVSKVPYDGMVYCVTVPTGCFIARRNGKIMTSMNSNYGMSSFLLQSVLAKDGYAFNKKETENLMEAYHFNYPGVRANYHNWIKELLSKDMTLENVFGRKTTFFDHWGNTLFNKAFAWIPQSTIGDMASTALINVYERMGSYSDLLVQVHDSLVLQTDYKNVTQDFMDELTDCMVIPLEIKGTKIAVPIDIELGTSWYDLVEWDQKYTYCEGII
jgi:DNA polymerase I-like protein with 3'-5' exonuclease and polymerase domains